MEIIGQVILLSLVFLVVSGLFLGLKFLKNMLNPVFRKNYNELKKITNDLKISGNYKKLINFNPEMEYKKKYSFIYDIDNRIENDELYKKKYEPQRIKYLKTVELVYYFSHDFRVARALRNHINSGDKLIGYLRNEIHRISIDDDKESLSQTDKILKSKKRFMDYLISLDNEDKEYLTQLSNSIDKKIK